MTTDRRVARTDVIVVGAGIAGLVEAERLREDGARVVVLEAGARPGGRLATDRWDGATFDHGAQFFTIRSDEFTALVERWKTRGCPIAVWSHGFAQSGHIFDGPEAAATGGDGFPRYVVRGGMNVLAGHVATALDVRPSHRVTAVGLRSGSARGARVAVTLATGSELVADHVVVTPTVPQGLALFEAGRTPVPEPTRSRLQRVAYDPCLAILLRLDRDPGLPAPGGVQFAGGPVQFLGDNTRKGTSPVPGVTVHLRGDVSRSRYDDPDDGLAADVVTWIRPWLHAAPVRSWQVKRWRYSQPTTLIEDRAVADAVDGARVVFAGDAFSEAKVEGAARSGLAAARAITA